MSSRAASVQGPGTAPSRCRSRSILGEPPRCGFSRERLSADPLNTTRADTPTLDSSVPSLVVHQKRRPLGVYYGRGKCCISAATASQPAAGFFLGGMCALGVSRSDASARLCQAIPEHLSQSFWGFSAFSLGASLHEVWGSSF